MGKLIARLMPICPFAEMDQTTGGITGNYRPARWAISPMQDRLARPALAVQPELIRCPLDPNIEEIE